MDFCAVWEGICSFLSSFRMICCRAGNVRTESRTGGEHNTRRTVSFDSRGGKPKPFTYSRSVPPAYECCRGFRLPPCHIDALLFSSPPFSSVDPPALRTPRPSRVFHTRACVSAETRTAIRRQPLAVYPQSIKATCQHEYQKPGVVDRYVRCM